MFDVFSKVLFLKEIDIKRRRGVNNLVLFYEMVGLLIVLKF